MTETHSGGSGPGALLRAAREGQGLHIAALAAAIKIAPRKLDALENDRWDELPDATFARALAQTVCRSLKIDARPILKLMPEAGAMELHSTRGSLNTPFRERPDRRGPKLAGAAVRPLVWAAVLLCVAAAAIYFSPEDLWRPKPRSRVAAARPAAIAPTAVATAPAAEAVAGSVPVPASAGESTAALASIPAEPLATQALAAAPLQFRTTGPSWIEARDARGQVLLSRLVTAGETVGVDGSLPIRLTIGNAAVTELNFRGHRIDLAQSSSGNVARVELQ